MERDTALEDAANLLELEGGQPFSAAADFLRRIELERSDAARKALEAAARRIEEQPGGEVYQKANKASAALLRRIKASL